jgi:hypothetical protein
MVLPLSEKFLQRYVFSLILSFKKGYCKRIYTETVQFYSPHPNITETLRKILKRIWIRPQDYVSTDTLFFVTNKALAALGRDLFINYSHIAALF